MFTKQLWRARSTVEYILSQGYSDDIEVDTDYLMMCRDLCDSKTLIVSGFPGTGKSYFFNTSERTILDSDSSKFDKSDFPRNYIEHIKENIDKVDVIFVSSHKDVRDALVKEKINFVLAYPSKNLKDEYIQRYIKRGSPEVFVNLISKNWDIWLDELDDQVGCYKQEMVSNIYLSDFEDTLDENGYPIKFGGI